MTGSELLGVGLIVLSAMVLMKSVSNVKVNYMPSTPLKKTTHSERLSAHGGLAGYIKFLYDLYHSQQVQSELVFWTPDRIKAEIKKSADAMRIPPEVLYGIIKHESGLRPVGIYADSVEKAVQANSSAFGVGQIVSKTFDSISPYVDFDHWDLWRPDRGVLAAAVLLRILYDKYGDTETVLRKYAGTLQGGQRLLSYIQAHGPEVA